MIWNRFWIYLSWYEYSSCTTLDICRRYSYIIFPSCDRCIFDDGKCTNRYTYHTYERYTCVDVFFFLQLVSMYECIEYEWKCESYWEYPEWSLWRVWEVLKSTRHGSYTDSKYSSWDDSLPSTTRILLHQSPDDETYDTDPAGNERSTPWEESVRYSTSDKTDTNIFDHHRCMWTSESHSEKNKNKISVSHLCDCVSDYVHESLIWV